MIRRLLLLSILTTFSLPLAIQAQTQIDPTTQIKWPLATGSGAPTLPCGHTDLSRGVWWN